MTVKINLGCGNQQLPGYFGLDRLHRAGVDLICDLNDPLPIASGSVDHIYAKSLLEHIDELEQLLGEVSRTLKPGGTFYIYVPHWSNPFYYSDYTHRRFFGLASFDYFAETGQQVYRHVPTYSDIRFETVSVRLLFKSPFRLLNWLMKAWQWLVNRTVTGQLFFEYHLSALVPCYALEYILREAEQGHD
ncbi:MAG: methyltransferase domain-containing protein [Chloroflexota bacterium]|jgi:predicted SAM-dependent methyltransferase